MELWIRTQHKMALIKSNGIYFKEEHREYSDGSVVKWCFYDHKSDSVIATYKTKERCLEILDEVQKILTRTGTFVFENVEPPQSKEELDALKKKIDEDGMVFLFSEFGNKAECELLPAPVVIYQMPEE